MKKQILAGILSAAVGIFAENVWYPGQAISPTAGSGPVLYDVTILYHPSQVKIYAAWADSAIGYSAVLQGGAWTTLPIPLSSSVKQNVNEVVNTMTGDVIAAWLDMSGTRWYSVYDGMMWSTTSLMSGAGGFNMNLAYDSSSNQVVGVWVDQMTSFPAVAYFDGMTWMGTALISGGTVANDVTVAYNSTDNTIFAAWKDQSTGAPFASVFSGGMWTTTAISMSLDAFKNVYLAYDSAANRMFASWADATTRLPYYSIYSSGSWSSPSLINGTQTVLNDVTLAFSTDLGSMYAAWGDLSSQAPKYAVYNTGAWTAGSMNLGISDGVAHDVFIANITLEAYLLASWSNQSDGTPIYSFFYPGSSPPPSFPPSFRRPYTNRPKINLGPG